MADDRLIILCESNALVDGADGVRFEVDVGGTKTSAFAVRFRGRVFAYLNRCAHVAMELDWLQGVFFDDDGQHLMCATHGALYEPASGRCAGGACQGRGGLRPIDVLERDGVVWWRPDGYVRVAGSG